MDAWLLEVFCSFFGVFQSLLFNHALVVRQAAFVKLEDLHIGWRVWVNILMNQVDYPLQKITHICFATPVLRFNQWQTNCAAIINVDMFEVVFEVDAWAEVRILFRECNLNRILTSLPNSPCSARHP